MKTTQTTHATGQQGGVNEGIGEACFYSSWDSRHLIIPVDVVGENCILPSTDAPAGLGELAIPNKLASSVPVCGPFSHKKISQHERTSSSEVEPCH